MTRRTTLADVAAEAGVAISTASRALAGDVRITASTTSAVLAAAAHLGYVPDAAARGLRNRRTRTLGMLLGDLADPWQSHVVAGFEAAARGTGHTVLFLAGGGRHEVEDRLVDILHERAVDGVALLATLVDPLEVAERCGHERVVDVQPPADAPLAGGGRRGDPRPGLLRVDDTAGMAALVGHLAGQGCRRLLFLGVRGRPASTVRRDAALRAAAAAGLTLEVVEAGGAAAADPEALARAATTSHPDAVLCCDDTTALRLLDGLRDRGVEVPADLAVTGFGDLPMAALANPRLTTVAMPATELGATAARALVAAITGDVLPNPVLLPVALVARESSRRLPA